jgi:hypothetical protein
LEKLGVDRGEDYIRYYSKEVVICELNGFVWLIICQGCTNTGSQDAVVTKFLRWLLIFVGPQYGTGVLSPYWHLEF